MKPQPRLPYGTAPENAVCKNTISNEETAVNVPKDSQMVNLTSLTEADFKKALETIQLQIETAKQNEFPQVFTANELISKTPQDLQMLMPPLLQQSGLAGLGGSSDTGKSSFLRQLAIAICTRQPDFLGFKLQSRYNSVIYVATEDGEMETGYLLKKQLTAFKEREGLENLRFIFNTENLLQNLDYQLSKQPADVVFIDCYADVFNRQNSDNTPQIRQFLNPYQTLASRYNTLILFLHHTGKRTEDREPSKNNLLGGQGFEAKMRVLFELRADFTAKNIRHLCVVKGNYISAEYKRESFVLEFDETTLTFKNTFERVEFAKLVKPPSLSEQKTQSDLELYEQIVALQNQGYTYDGISGKLGVSKGTISKIKARVENAVSKSVSSGNNGNNNGNKPR